MGSVPLVALADALGDVAHLGLDTPVFVYFAERNPTYLPLAREVFRLIDAGLIAGHTSVVTLVEVLTHPKRTRDVVQEGHFRSILLNNDYLTVRDTTPLIAERAADLRARYNLRTPDAIQIATALVAGCEAFLTNDLDLRRVADLRVLVLGTLTL